MMRNRLALMIALSILPMTEGFCLQGAEEDPPAGNKWKIPAVPNGGWTCTHVEDLGEPEVTCQMCDSKEIRYVHTMEHPDCTYKLYTGCVCAGNMSGDAAGAQAREADLRSRAQRRAGWLDRVWKTSKSHNPYLRTRAVAGDPVSHMVVITSGRFGRFSASVDSKYLGTWYGTPDEAKLAAFNHLWPPARAI